MKVRWVFGAVAGVFALSLAVGCGGGGTASTADGGAKSLMSAAEQGDYRAVNLLLAQAEPKIDVNTQDEKGMTALHHAAGSNASGSAQVIESLLDEGADPTIQDAEGQTPVEVAQKAGNMRAVSMFSKTS